MALARYEPWDLVGQLHQQINHIFDTQYRNDTGTSATADWSPPADVEEYADRFLLKLDVPGVDLNSVNITLDQGVLSISGDRAKQAVAKGVERSRIERPYGKFHRRFTLPDTVDAAGVSASGNLGVLEITIPKQPKTQPRRIEISTAN